MDTDFRLTSNVERDIRILQKAEEIVFARRLGRLLEEKNVTPEAVDNKLNLMTGSTAVFLSRKVAPQKTTVERIAKFLKVPFEALWTDFVSMYEED